jgi:ribonuclease R
MKIRKDAVLKLLSANRGEPVQFRELASLSGVDRNSRQEFKALLDGWVAEGALMKLKGNRYALPEGKGEGEIVGKLSVHPDGYGFVIPDSDDEDIFIPARYLRENLHGDRVAVSVMQRGRYGKREGRIVRTLERGCTKVVGRFFSSRGYSYVMPDELRLPREIRVSAKGMIPVRDGQVVMVEITAYPAVGRSAEGRISEVLGWPEDPEVEVLTIIRKFDLPSVFPSEVIASARAVSQTVTDTDIGKRTDLRDFLTVTIDGETARDFDDAVSVKRERGGKIRLWVSIADVAHYVPPGSELDAEAYRRGTSVYFPDRCLPMLPEELSNGICSLNPQVDRLALTAELLYDRTGAVMEKAFYPSVIRSDARLTYTIVRRILVDRDAEALDAHQDILGDLQIMEELAHRLMTRRRQRGSIDFDLPEPEIVLDLQGQTEAIVRAERNLAHRIIEEFMLAANEAVASFLEERFIPSLYRVHEQPDPVKLHDFREFVHSFGYVVMMDEERVEPGELQRLLEQAEGKPEERMINEVLLRCMKQARYAAENLGHFGLASPCYTHFTSPIRRYPDLVVHRILKRTLAGRMKGEDRERFSATLPDVAAQTSSRERVAIEAEREIVALKKVQFMRNRVGEEFDGFITGVSAYGFYVELIELFVEGMVHISTLGRDFYQYVEKQHALLGERTKETFRIGDRVRVRVVGVSLEKKQIDFVVAAEADARPPREVSAVGEYPRIPIKGKRLVRGKQNTGPSRPAQDGKGGARKPHGRKRR